MESHMFFKNVDLPDPLNQQELEENFKKMKNGDDQSRTKIIEHNIRLVTDIVIKYFSNSNFDCEDLVSIGIIGLIKSVDTFDLSKKFAFSTYATKTIKNEILSHFRTNKSRGKKEVSFENIVQNSSSTQEVSLLNILKDEKSDFESDYIKKESCEIIRKLVSELPDLQKEIIEQYFGFSGNEPRKQREIAISLGISRSSVAMTTAKVLNEMTFQLKKEGIVEKGSYRKVKK